MKQSKKVIELQNKIEYYKKLSTDKPKYKAKAIQAKYKLNCILYDKKLAKFLKENQKL